MDFQDLTLSKVPVIEVWPIYKRDSIGFSFEIIIPIRRHNFSEERNLGDILMEASSPIVKNGKAINVSQPIIKQID